MIRLLIYANPTHILWYQASGISSICRKSRLIWENTLPLGLIRTNFEMIWYQSTSGHQPTKSTKNWKSVKYNFNRWLGLKVWKRFVIYMYTYMHVSLWSLGRYCCGIYMHLCCGIYMYLCHLYAFMLWNLILAFWYMPHALTKFLHLLDWDPGFAPVNW